MEWGLLFVPLDLFEVGLRRFGFQAKQYALVGTAVAVLALLAALGAVALRRRWSGRALAALGLGVWLVTMAGVMPLTGAGFFAADLFRGTGAAVAGYLAVALAYAAALAAARALAAAAAAPPPGGPPAAGRRRPHPARRRRLRGHAAGGALEPAPGPAGGDRRRPARPRRRGAGAGAEPGRRGPPGPPGRRPGTRRTRTPPPTATSAARPTSWPGPACRRRVPPPARRGCRGRASGRSASTPAPSSGCGSTPRAGPRRRGRPTAGRSARCCWWARRRPAGSRSCA